MPQNKSLKDRVVQAVSRTGGALGMGVSKLLKPSRGAAPAKKLPSKSTKKSWKKSLKKGSAHPPLTLKKHGMTDGHTPPDPRERSTVNRGKLPSRRGTGNHPLAGRETKSERIAGEVEEGMREAGGKKKPDYKQRKQEYKQRKPS